MCPSTRDREVQRASPMRTSPPRRNRCLGQVPPASKKPGEIPRRRRESKWPEVLQSRELTEGSRADEPTRIDVSARELVAFGPSESAGVDSVDQALAFALAEAAK